ncbi:TetR/AcrR family transcriptional regulator [Ktedonospora formicarum]|uniref:TetR family transcriptional regulator n=1 Tax=Ktedonospora formicarum TaxID=2778364 RepID=A0A8J3I3Y0_9CHLR|nr:TetR/AcrR family transcriptional regulator [Ktedonospora formicarum]GHO49727.1 TetR family transcriptional regulator [Ktedonospora formicarum]
MKHKKTDRRSTRTQRLLGEALVALLLEKRYDAITVQDILERADIGRSTFYEHYWDKEDLLTSQAEWLVESLGNQFEQSSKSHPHDPSVWLPSLALFEHIATHYHHYQALLRGGAVTIFTQTLQQQLRMRVRTQLQATWTRSNEEDVLDAVASYVVGTFVTLMQWWLDSEMSWSPQRTHMFFHMLVSSGIHQVLVQGLEPGKESEQAEN